MPVGSSKDLDPVEPVVCAFDLDNFYVACERLRDPSLIGLPVGIQQKNILATCSYEARASVERGIGKLQSVKEAKRICPDLVIVNGEDLTNYRVQSRKVWRLVKSIVGPSCAVEKLGMDELFVDVTSLIARHLLDTSRREASSSTSNHTVLFTCDNGSSFSYRPGAVVGHTAPSTSEHVQHWHAVATHLAAHIREAIHRDLGLTVSGGVAHNKLLSKLLAAVHKPAKQTCLAQASADDLQRFLDPLPVQKLPGFGYRTRLTIAEHLPLSSEAAEVQKNEVEDDAPVEERYKVADLRRRATEQKLCTWLDPKIGPRLWALLHGQDEAAVVMTPDYPAQITVEDSFGGLNDFADVMRNTEALTLHLIERLELELLEEPMAALSSSSSSSSPHPEKIRKNRAFVRFPTQLRLAVRIDPAPRESKTTALPAEMLDLNVPRSDRARFVSTTVLMPLLKASLQSKSPNQIRIINVGVTGLSTVAPPPSVKQLLGKTTSSGATSSSKRKTPASSSSYKRGQIDESVLEELPEALQAEVRRELGMKSKVPKTMASCQYKCGAVILPGAMEAHLKWHRQQRR